MPKRLEIRELTEQEQEAISRLSHSQTAPIRQRERACMIQWASEKQRVSQIAARLGITEQTVRRWLTRFNEGGLSAIGHERPLPIYFVQTGTTRRWKLRLWIEGYDTDLGLFLFFADVLSNLRTLLST